MFKKGSKHTEETKRKMSKTKTGHLVSRDTREKIRIANLGSIVPEERKRKISIGLKGIKRSSEEIEKSRKKRTGLKRSAETCNKISIATRGKKRSEETKRKMSQRMIGEKNHSWAGGLSNNPYPKEFNEELKLKIRQRDNFVCCLCGRTEREELEELNRVLCINHKDFNKNNCNEKNLNTLCLRCNVKINREREYWTNYFNQKYEE